MVRHNLNFEYALVAFAAISIGALAYPTILQDQGYNVPNDTAQCVNDLVAWCAGMKYPQEGAGMSMVSITIAEPDGYYRALCTDDYDGTNCTRNGQPWFSCSRENKLFYKGQPLNNGSTEGADDGICGTADKAFNELFVQSLTYDNTTLKNALEKGMESFFQHMAEMQEEIEYLQHRMFNIFGGGGFASGPKDETTLGPSDTGEDNSTQSTGRERE